MKRLTLLLAILLTACVNPPTSAVTPRTDFVAHALGTPSTSPLTYCNCREAFLSSYARGFRTFEADVIMAADNVPFAYHGAQHDRLRLTSDEQVLSSTSATLDTAKIDNRYDTLTGHDLLSLLATHPDATLFLHTKFSDYTTIPAWFLRHTSPSVRARIVPYVWSAYQVNTLRRLGATRFIIPIHEHLKVTVTRAVSLAKTHNINAVVGSSATFTPSVLDTLERSGVQYIYADRGWRKYAATDTDEKKVLTDRLKRGLRVYSDRWIG